MGMKQTIAAGAGGTACILLAATLASAEPLRDVVEGLMKPDLDLLKPQTRTFMKDCVDHARHAADVVENQAGHVDSLIDLYMNLVNLRMNWNSEFRRLERGRR